MNGPLQFNSQKWQLQDADGLKLYLPRQHQHGCVYFQANWSFVPSDVEMETAPADVPKLRLRIIGFVPGLRDWRDLESLFLGYHEPIDGSEELPETRGPDIFLWPPGETKPFRHGSWESDLKFGERRGREFDFSLEGLCRSERASKFLTDQHVKEFFQQPVSQDWELPEWIDEGDQLSFEGRVELKEIVCSVPINCAQPAEWARQFSRRELAVEKFGPCSVSGGGHSTGKYDPQDDIGGAGRLAVLQMAPD